LSQTLRIASYDDVVEQYQFLLGKAIREVETHEHYGGGQGRFATKCRGNAQWLRERNGQHIGLSFPATAQEQPKKILKR